METRNGCILIPTGDVFQEINGRIPASCLVEDNTRSTATGSPYSLGERRINRDNSFGIQRSSGRTNKSGVELGAT